MLDILYEDAHILVVNKPAGLSTQAPLPTVPTLEREVRSYLDPNDPTNVYLGTVHRLDRPVSGVVLFAKHTKAARRLAKQFEGRRVEKVYWAVVEGPPLRAPESWSDWLYEENTGAGGAQVVLPGTPRARSASSDAAPLPAELPEGLRALELRPNTGRMHQLRIQCASRGRPIVGDRQYGSKRDFSAGIALHARRLAVGHPALERKLTFLAPMPPSWSEAGIAIADADSRGVLG